LLIKESVSGTKIPVEFREDYITFKDKIIGIHAPEKEKEELQKLEGYLKNDSSVPLIWLSSGQVIGNREGVPIKDDILSLPFPQLKYDQIDKILLDDISLYYSDFRKRGEKSNILNPVNEDDLKSFGEIYCKILNSIYDNFKSLDAIIGKEFIAYPFILGSKPEIEIPETLEGVEEKLKKLIDHQASYNLWVKRIIKVYHKNIILLYKPNQKRYWLKSIAIRDADETFNDLYKQGK